MYHYSPIADRMTRDRFHDISRNNATLQNISRIRLAVRPVIDHLLSCFLDLYNPHKEVAVDRAMIKFTSHSTLKQFMPTKPVCECMCCVYTCAWVCVATCVCVYLCLCVCVRVYICVCAHMCLSVCMRDRNVNVYQHVMTTKLHNFITVMHWHKATYWFYSDYPGWKGVSKCLDGLRWW